MLTIFKLCIHLCCNLFYYRKMYHISMLCIYQLFIYLLVYLFFYLFIYLLVCLFFYLLIYLFIYLLFIYLFILFIHSVLDAVWWSDIFAVIFQDFQKNINHLKLNTHRCRRWGQGALCPPPPPKKKRKFPLVTLSRDIHLTIPHYLNSMIYCNTCTSMVVTGQKTRIDVNMLQILYVNLIWCSWWILYDAH